MNGEVSMYEIGKPIDWKTFKSYPKEMQQEWINAFCARFDCTGKGMELVFGIKNPSIYPLLKRNGVSIPQCGVYTPGKGEAILAWIKESSEEPAAEKEEAVEPKPVVEVKREPVKPEMPYFVQTLRQGSMELSGTATEIFHTLFGIFRDAKIELSINFEVIPEPEPEIEEEPEEIVAADDEVEDTEDYEDDEDDEKVNLNACTFKDLRAIGFSPNIAANVMQHRPYQKVEDLLRVPGMNRTGYQILSLKVKV